MPIGDPIPNAAVPTPGQGIALDLNGQLPLAVRQLLPGYELDYAQITSNASITATTEATANTVVTGGAVTYNGTTAIVIEFYSYSIVKGTTNIALWLYDGAASIGQIAFNNAGSVPVQAARRLTPSAAAHTYSIRATVDAGTGTVAAGAGGLGTQMPAFLRITKA